MMDANPLWIDPAEMRRLGYRAVDAVVELWEQLRDAPVTGGGDRAAMEALFREPLPRQGAAIDGLIERFTAEMVTHSSRTAHPRFFAFIPGSPVYPSFLGDLLASGANIFAGSWLGSPAASMVELVVLDWVKELIGYPAGAEGLFVSGGSVANWTALAVAREEAAIRDGGDAGDADEAGDRAVFYTSDQRHTSVDRAVRALGYASGCLNLIPTGAGCTVDVADLERAIAADRARGRLPLAIVAHAGTTNTGAVDPLEGIADLAARERIWLHVDAAYGGFAAMTERGRDLLAGMERADSIALDPHKWLFQTFECACVLVRHRGALARSFSRRGDYMREVPTGEREVSFVDRGLQLSRKFHALKVWMTLKAFGADALAAAIERGLDLAREAARDLEAAGFEIVAPPVLGIVGFRMRDRDDRAQLALLERINRSGEAMLTSTTIQGRAVLRLCVLSPWTTEEDIRRTVARLSREAGA